jgi:hypothetical protein
MPHSSLLISAEMVPFARPAGWPMWPALPRHPRAGPRYRVAMPRYGRIDREQFNRSRRSSAHPVPWTTAPRGRADATTCLAPATMFRLCHSTMPTTTSRRHLRLTRGRRRPLHLFCRAVLEASAARLAARRDPLPRLALRCTTAKTYVRQVLPAVCVCTIHSWPAGTSTADAGIAGVDGKTIAHPDIPHPERSPDLRPRHLPRRYPELPSATYAAGIARPVRRATRCCATAATGSTAC